MTQAPTGLRNGEIEAVGNQVTALAVRDEAHGRVVGQRWFIVSADGRVDVPRVGSFSCRQRNSKETAPKPAPTDLGMNVRPLTPRPSGSSFGLPGQARLSDCAKDSVLHFCQLCRVIWPRTPQLDHD